MPRDPAAQQEGWRAELALAFARRDGRSVLASRRLEGPLVVQKALHPEGPEVCHAIVVHPPAGVAGGDDLVIRADVGAGAHALLTTPGAGKWYRSTGPWASQHVEIDVGEGAVAEWLPQETILYDGSKSRLAFTARLAHGARLVAWDLFCLGRTASGEGFARGECAIASRLERSGRPLWIERGRIAPGFPAAASPAGLASQPVFGTFVAAAPGVDDAWLAGAREERPARGEAAATRLPGVLLARYRGDSTEAARAYFAALWRRLRPAAAGREAHEPRIWRT